ncbi:MAG: hypothetical protein ABJA66_11935 [Actinomycetota bacterium]
MYDEISDFNVVDRLSFIKFLELLRKDLAVNSEYWENKTLDDFLEALSRYTEDIQALYDNTGQQINADEPSWNVFADIFKSARIYE